MKKQVLFPITLLFSAMIACFLLGAITGTIITYLLIDPESKEISHKTTLQRFILPEKAWVKEVIDGDNIVVVADQQELRLVYLGIDAPDNKVGSSPYYAEEAYEKNKNLVEGKTVKLKWDKELAEEHSNLGTINSLRAYVYVDNIFVNAELIKQGFAAVYRRQRESVKHSFSSEFESLEMEAKANFRGIWNLKEKELWEKERGFNALDNPTVYIADDQFFHRPECPKVKEIRLKRYYYQREKAIKDTKCCPICKP